jgi:hypothetical protein
MKYFFTLSILIFTCLKIQAANTCTRPAVDKKAFINLSQFITEHPTKSNILSGHKIKAGEKIETHENEFTNITFEKPYRVEFQIDPGSEVEILNVGDNNCGPQIKLNKGQILSSGQHPASEKCPFEIETEEAYIQPTGTSYLVESGALSEAIAELNGDASGENNLVGVGETGTIDEGSFEKYSVKKGTIKIKLKRISKNKLKNKIKYAKTDDGKKSKLKKSLTKGNSNKVRFLAYNEKIKLGAKSSLSVKRKKSNKKTQTADLEILSPSGI